MASRIQIRRDTKANWASTNPVLADGEMGYEKDTRLTKVGDGSTSWNSLPYEVELKTKIVTGTTGAAEGDLVQINHGIDATKVHSISAVVIPATGTSVPPEYSRVAGYQYSITTDTDPFNLQLSATNSENILSKPFRAVIWYLP